MQFSYFEMLKKLYLEHYKLFMKQVFHWVFFGLSLFHERHFWGMFVYQLFLWFPKGDFSEEVARVKYCLDGRVELYSYTAFTWLTEKAFESSIRVIPCKLVLV